ncbi:CatB-related O-acetyltransferase [Paraburkholderia caballeronis]|uniref:CatB-related O-acetyltransferase n=1 Tax=Paraburkholderia caballeronis TaxID=416943 RepID=UPI001065D462|nr:CatB-related O-acetyltransferase [Paraburkholderia caballeronis]
MAIRLVHSPVIATCNYICQTPIKSMLINIKLTSTILNALQDLRIYSTHRGNGRRFSIDQTISFDSKARIEPYVGFCVGQKLFSAGAFSYAHSELDPLQRIGRYCSIASSIKNFSAKHPLEFLSTSHFNFCDIEFYRQALEDLNKEKYTEFNVFPYKTYDAPAQIGHDVWIGDNVLLGRNINIGTGSVIGANSVVTHDVPPYAIVAGVPARIIRYRFPDNLIAKLLGLEWWDYSFTDFYNLPYPEPEKFVDHLQNLIDSGKIRKFQPDNRPFAERLISKLDELGEPVPDSLSKALIFEKEREALNDRFPVPESCTNWHRAELDPRDGALMRFFAYQAWTEIDVTEDTSAIEFLVNFHVSTEAIDKFEVSVSGYKLTKILAGQDSLGRHRVRFEIPFHSNTGKRVVRLDLFCPISRRPSLQYANSKDSRILSLAISKPKLINTTRSQ